jgi:hypothetical protein
MVSCDNEEPTLPVAGPFQLWAINRPICPGMEVQLYLYEQATGSVVDFSEFTFEVVPNGLGEISSTGLFKAPELISGQSNVVITAKWKSNPNIQASHTLYLTSNSSKRYPTNPTQIVKLSQELDILNNYSINHSVYSFLVNQDDAVIAYYSDEVNEESGIVMVDKFGEEFWNLSLPYRPSVHSNWIRV